MYTTCAPHVHLPLDPTFAADDETSYWKIPAAGAYSWVAFDLGSKYTLTGIRLAGWFVHACLHAC